MIRPDIRAKHASAKHFGQCERWLSAYRAGFTECKGMT